MGSRIDNFAPPGSMLKQPKEPKLKTFRKVSNKPPKKIRARNPNSAAAKREGNSKEYTSIILQLPCLVPGCKRHPVENHHLKTGMAAAERGAGMKATDMHQIPLCSGHHRLDKDCVESAGSRNELRWFSDRGLDVLAISARMWAAFKAGEDYAGVFWAMREAPQVHSNGETDV